ncbi:hypothetical protein V6B05_01335 [Lactococcus garvieae]|uniref:hypothetical protein n=1 Tax=Lactococcus garvieae TaxID=1363 RepID=UPI001F62234B|nr:hypothetical protein [Lactococcus garvieae]MCI3860070.1 hypothetical protein [Lactococcus garvieae]
MSVPIELLSKFHKNAPPFISENEDGSYSLVGESDLASGELTHYEGIGDFKLTAKNHSKTLIALMKFILEIDAISEEELLSFEDEEVNVYLSYRFTEVMIEFFGEDIDFIYTDELAEFFILNNKQLVNEAIYNLTKDKKDKGDIDYQAIVDGLEGSQFEDPYLNIAYEIAKEFSLRPWEVVDKWSTSELIVAFAKLSNDKTQEAFLNYKYSDPKKKAPVPKKQKFFFEKVVEEDEEVDDG